MNTREGGLLEKRAEIAGRIEHNQDKLRHLVIALDALDATIHLFDPSIEREEVMKPPVHPPITPLRVK